MSGNFKMNNFVNDLHTEGRIANDLDRARIDYISTYPAAVITAARTDQTMEIARLLFARTGQSMEIARLLLKAGSAIANFISSFSWNAIREAHRYNKAVNQLEAMDDRTLRDMGLSRSTIRYAVRGHMPDERQEEKTSSLVKPVGVEGEIAPSAANCNKVKRHHHTAA
jgi:uncharacterized protein YjiS (DUF1127 family)